MATLLRSDGSTEVLQPSNGVNWSLPELQILVGGYIEVVHTTDGKFLIVDDEGKLKLKPLNVAATRLYQHGRRDVIAGDAVLIETRLEMDGPEEEEEPEA
jgi:hypothetical protein